MTVPAGIPAALPDLRAVPLASLPSLPPAALEQALRRILPGRAVEDVTPAGDFSSAI